MKVLLRNRATRLYLGPDPETWGNVDQAKDFKTTALAIHAVVELRLQVPVEVLLSFEDPRYNITLPLHR